jgi:hypothetical protein
MKRNSENGCDFFKINNFFGVAIVLTRPGRQTYLHTSRVNGKCLPVTLCRQLLYVCNTQSMLQYAGNGDGLKNSWFGWWWRREIFLISSSFLFIGYRGSGRPGLKLTTHFHRVSRLRMSGAIPLVPLYAFSVPVTVVV